MAEILEKSEKLCERKKWESSLEASRGFLSTKTVDGCIIGEID